MSRTPTAAPSIETRDVPRLGGFNLTFLAIEIRRLLRNRRTVIVTLVVPIALFLLFKSTRKAVAIPGIEITSATTMIGIAVYGAMLAATSGGAMVSIERALGWSRQLRLTPLRPFAYITMKVFTAMVLGIAAILSAFAIGALSGVHMEPMTWLMAGLAAWACSLVFAAFGLFMGFLLPSENVMQFVGPLLAILAMFGGLFVPLHLLPPLMQTIAKFTPVYGVGIISRSPLVGGFTMLAVASVVGWTAVFGFGAMLLFRRDTARV